MDIDTNIVEVLVKQIMHGGPESIAAFMGVIVILLLWDRHRLLKEITKKDERLNKIVDDYYKGNITLADALVQLRGTLLEIRQKL